MAKAKGMPFEGLLEAAMKRYFLKVPMRRLQGISIFLWSLPSCAGLNYVKFTRATRPSGKISQQ